jgi:predicted dehydrogenase
MSLRSFRVILNRFDVFWFDVFCWRPVNERVILALNMNTQVDFPNPSGSRRDFIKTGTKLATVAALAGVSIPHVHAAGSDTLQLALIGCGGRGTGAAADALNTKAGPMKLVAMADVFEHRLNTSYANLSERYSARVDVPKDRQFIGFDAYRQAMDCLKPGDIAIFTTPPAFRWVHFGYAIQKGVHVFMEKPVTVDAPTTRRMFELADASEKKNLKVGVGLMVRHCRARQALLEKIKAGELGEILMLRAYRMGNQAAIAGPKPAKAKELLYQVQRFHSFLWASGGLFSDYNIHQIDECCWMKGAWPVKAHALGGRSQTGCKDEFASYAHGTKGSAVISTAAHSPGRCRVFKGHNITKADMTWAFQQPERSPYQFEWDDLTEAIRNDKPYNEARRGATASLVTSMGRMAAHTGQEITYEEMLKVDHEFAPEVDKLTMDSPAPLRAGSDGRYPVPQPGIKKDREY